MPTTTHTVRAAKATEKDITTTREFLTLCEEMFEPRFGYSNNWEERDEDDPMRVLFFKLRKRVADDEDQDESQVDIRLVEHELIKHVFNNISGYYRVMMNVEVLIENCTDPHLNYLEWHPSVQLHHVANEQ